MKRIQPRSGRERVDASEFIKAEEELHRLKEERGIKEHEGPISRIIAWYYGIKDRHEPVRVPRKRYILITALTGFAGGHLFYTHHYVKAVIYLLLCWTGFPLAMALIDILIAVPMAPDEDGCIEM